MVGNGHTGIGCDFNIVKNSHLAKVGNVQFTWGASLGADLSLTPVKPLVTFALLTASATAQTVGHTDITSFNNALAAGAVVTTLDFDSLSSGAGDMIPSGTVVDGFDFDFDFGGVVLRVGDSNTTTSTPHYLGTTDADLLQDGDDFNVIVDPSNSFGTTIITADIMVDNDMSLTFNGVTVSLVALDFQQLTDDSFVYFLGVTSDIQTDTTALITTIGGGFFLYNVNDIVRAEDPTILLGDVNLDGIVNLLDVEPFIAVLSVATFQAEAGCDENGVVNLLDVDPFILILSGGYDCRCSRLLIF